MGMNHFRLPDINNTLLMSHDQQINQVLLVFHVVY